MHPGPDAYDEPDLNLDAKLTIAQVVLYFDGNLSYRAVDEWVRRKLAPHTKDRRGRILIRLGDALEAEATTHIEKRGRPRKNQPIAA